QEMTRVYRDAAMNVDVPRLHQREIATLRAFDVMASGGLLLVSFLMLLTVYALNRRFRIGVS
ncbi:MAG: hypothetical protein AAB316_13825, partial [Bacteroidota bacterium]